MNLLCLFSSPSSLLAPSLPLLAPPRRSIFCFLSFPTMSSKRASSANPATTEVKRAKRAAAELAAAVAAAATAAAAAATAADEAATAASAAATAASALNPQAAAEAAVLARVGSNAAAAAATAAAAAGGGEAGAASANSAATSAAQALASSQAATASLATASAPPAAPAAPSAPPVVITPPLAIASAPLVPPVATAGGGAGAASSDGVGDAEGGKVLSVAASLRAIDPTTSWADAILSARVALNLPTSQHGMPPAHSVQYVSSDDEETGDSGLREGGDAGIGGAGGADHTSAGNSFAALSSILDLLRSPQSLAILSELSVAAQRSFTRNLHFILPHPLRSLITPPAAMLDFLSHLNCSTLRISPAATRVVHGNPYLTVDANLFSPGAEAKLRARVSRAALADAIYQEGRPAVASHDLVTREQRREAYTLASSIEHFPSDGTPIAWVRCMLAYAATQMSVDVVAATATLYHCAHTLSIAAGPDPSHVWLSYDDFRRRHAADPASYLELVSLDHAVVSQLVREGRPSGATGLQSLWFALLSIRCQCSATTAYGTAAPLRVYSSAFTQSFPRQVATCPIYSIGRGGGGVSTLPLRRSDGGTTCVLSPLAGRRATPCAA